MKKQSGECFKHYGQSTAADTMNLKRILTPAECFGKKLKFIDDENNNHKKLNKVKYNPIVENFIEEEEKHANENNNDEISNASSVSA